MLQSRVSMFCPQCKAEYPSRVHRCSDCDVPLAERLPLTRGDSKRTRVSGFVIFKESGVFMVIPVTVLATMLVFVALRGSPFETQIASIFASTGCVFLFVFCDAGPGQAIKGKGTRGFSLGEEGVKQMLPLLGYIHVGSLVVRFAGVTGAMRLRRHIWFLCNLDTDDSALILFLAGGVIAFARIHFSDDF
jgi:hypothetical protein